MAGGRGPAGAARRRAPLAGHGRALRARPAAAAVPVSGGREGGGAPSSCRGTRSWGARGAAPGALWRIASVAARARRGALGGVGAAANFAPSLSPQRCDAERRSGMSRPAGPCSAETASGRKGHGGSSALLGSGPQAAHGRAALCGLSASRGFLASW